MTSRTRPEGAVYELTVVGRLGPVLMRALQPYARGSAEALTIMLASLPDDRDLVDLVFWLRSRGLEINSVAVVA